MKLTTTNNNKQVKSVYQKVLEARFHEVALWAWITAVRNFNQKVSIPDIIRSYQGYMGLDEDSLDSEVAYISYYRMNNKMIKAHGEIATSKPNKMIDKVSVDDLNEIRSALIGVKDEKVKEVVEKINEHLKYCENG